LEKSNLKKKMTIEEVKRQEDDEDCEIIGESPSATPAASPRESGEKPGVSGIPGNSGEIFGNGPSIGDSQCSQEDKDLIQQEASDPHPIVCQSV
jgi:hypothetical protein